MLSLQDPGTSPVGSWFFTGGSSQDEWPRGICRLLLFICFITGVWPPHALTITPPLCGSHPVAQLWVACGLWPTRIAQQRPLWVSRDFFPQVDMLICQSSVNPKICWGLTAWIIVWWNFLFPRLLYNWSMSLPCNIVLKKAVDSLLCSMCHVHPSYFSLLMSWMGIVSVPSTSHSQAQHHHLAITDDGKKQHDASTSAAGLTDDSKHARLPINLSESQLTTLAAASQSPRAIEQLLDSGLPSLLVRSLTQFCVGLLASADLPLPAAQAERRHHPHHYHSPHSSAHSRPPLAAELAAPVLRFLTEVGNSHTMKDWLGGPEVNPLWTALLFLLCHSSASASAGAGSQPVGSGSTPSPPPTQPQPPGSRFSLVSSGHAGGLTTQQRTALENATVAFFLQCISCHPNNQRLMAQVSAHFLLSVKLKILYSFRHQV